MKRVKVKKRIRDLCRQQLKYEDKVSKIRFKLFYQPYKELAEAIEKEFSKSLFTTLKEKVGKLVNGVFKPKMKEALKTSTKHSIDQFIDFFTNIFKRPLKDTDVQNIKTKIFNEYTQKYTTSTLTNVTETLTSKINKIIKNGLDKGLSTEEITNKIVIDTKGVIGQTRAQMIAREETAKVMETVNYETAVKVKSKEKTWLHIGGGKTDRKSHLALHGITIKINEKFSVGAEGKVPAVEMRFPKDPECSVAGQIIGCRCKVSYS